MEVAGLGGVEAEVEEVAGVRGVRGVGGGRGERSRGVGVGRIRFDKFESQSARYTKRCTEQDIENKGVSSSRDCNMSSLRTLAARRYHCCA